MLLLWCDFCILYNNLIYLSSFRVRFTVFHSIFHYSSLQLNSDHVVFSLRTKLRNICVQLVAAWISFQRETRNLIMQLNSRLLMQEHFSNRFTSCIRSSDRQHKANTHPSAVWLKNPALFYEQKQYFVCFERLHLCGAPRGGIQKATRKSSWDNGENSFLWKTSVPSDTSINFPSKHFLAFSIQYSRIAKSSLLLLAEGSQGEWKGKKWR